MNRKNRWTAGMLLVVWMLSAVSTGMAAETVKSQSSIYDTGLTGITGAQAEEQQNQGNTTQGNTTQEEVLPTELDLGDYLAEMAVGEKQLLSVTVLPTGTTDQTMTYHSDNPQVATVNGMGRITTVSVGTTTITAQCQNIQASFGLTVKAAESTQDPKVTVSKIEIADHEEKLYVGKTLTLQATVLPSDTTDSTVTYTSDHTEIATVSSTGEVKGISPGTVTITAKAGEVTTTIPLTVKIATDGIELNRTCVVLQPGQTFQLKGSAAPKEAEQSLTYQSADTQVAEVSQSGAITAKKIGNTTILVSNGDGNNAVTVIVNEEENASDQSAGQDGLAQGNSGQTLTQQEQTLLGLISNKNTVEIQAEEYPTITTAVLTELYRSKKVLEIKGDDYLLQIKGEDIVNCENELLTKLTFKKEKDGVSFVLNEENNLPGIITVSYDKQMKYLYLYNNAKEKYQKISTKDMSHLKLDEGGKYLLTDNKLSSLKVSVVILVTVGCVMVLLGIVYVLVMRRYWFW